MYIAIFPRSHGSEGKKVKIGLGRHLPMEHNVTALRCAVLCSAVVELIDDGMRVCGVNDITGIPASPLCFLEGRGRVACGCVCQHVRLRYGVAKPEPPLAMQ
jgi:hypothetical protein